MQTSLASRSSYSALPAPPLWRKPPSSAHSGVTASTGLFVADSIEVTALPITFVIGIQSMLLVSARTAEFIQFEHYTFAGNSFVALPSTFAGNSFVALPSTAASTGESFLPEASWTISCGLQQTPIVKHVGHDESMCADGTSPTRDAHFKKLPLWKKIQAITATIPAAEWDSVPRDLASNVDKYLYRKGDGR